MKLELLYAKKLTTREIEKLKRYTFTGTGEFEGNGELADNLESYRNKPGTRVIRLTDNVGRILSWGLVVPYAKNYWDFQLYTRRDVRGRGYGTLVYDKAVQVAHGRDNMEVHPHDPVSGSFFSAVHYDESRKGKKKRKLNANH